MSILLSIITLSCSVASPNTKSPSPNTHHPSSNTHQPSPNTHRPSPNTHRPDTIRRNLYLKFNIDINRRNFMLVTVPDLYVITSGRRHHIGEKYGLFRYYGDGRFDYDETISIGTIDHQRTVFRSMLPYVVPTPYNEELFPGFILSPFNKVNRRLYRYSSYTFGDDTYVTFRPRVRNSTLTNGSAVIDAGTGLLRRAHFNGEYDHVEYHLGVNMDSIGRVPAECRLQARFRFLGNDISTRLHACYDSTATTLPDTIHDSNSPRLMALIRSDSLTASDRSAYAETYDSIDTRMSRYRRRIIDRAWAVIDDYVVSGLQLGRDNANVRFSPLLDPLGFDYSNSKGISYRLKMHCTLKSGSNSHLDFFPSFSYYFKRKRLYYQLPLRYTFNDRRDGFAEFYYVSGNRISDSRVLDMLKDNTRRDTINFDSLGLEHFKDRELTLRVNIPIGRYLHLGLATVCHIRKSVKAGDMEQMGEQATYRSFAPSVTLRYQPTRSLAVTVNYERGIPHVIGSDLRYERIEGDVQMSKRFSALSSLDIRFGAGGYTHQQTTFFVDYDNFTENNLPETWDEWKGRFYLLHSDLYNASSYYIRANVSYESPLLPLAYLPFVGYYIEKECVYLNAVQLKRTRPYFEIGYAFTTRFASFGLFAGMFGPNFNEIGTKLTFELFRHW